MKRPETNSNTGKTPAPGTKETTVYTFEAIHKCLKGVPLAKAGKMQEALEAFDGAIDDDPTLASSWYNKGFVLCSRERYEEALAAFDKAIEINPRFPHPWNGRGYVLCTLKRYREALEAFERALEIYPAIPYAWTGIGNANIGIEHFQEALEAFNRAIEMDPKFALPWHSKAILLEVKPELEIMAGHTARQSFSRAVHLRDTCLQMFPLNSQMLIDPIKQLNLHLLTNRLFNEIGAANIRSEDKQFMDQIACECAAPLAMLNFLDSAPKLNNVEKAFWSGIIYYYYGDPVRAVEFFDKVDSSDETNLAGQYYLLLSLGAVLEPLEKEKIFALKQAEAILGNPGNEVSALQRYYAGLIFCFARNWEQAMVCFAGNSNHIPSLYMKYKSLRMQNSGSTAPVIADILEQELTQVQQRKSSYLIQPSLPEIDPGRADWIENTEFSTYFMELLPVIQDILEHENLNEFENFRKLIELQNKNFTSQTAL
ncbi:MAG: hypothetical protein A2283_19910 [Lentisphaerae bacterium RIFOXYA12_FULL_48_11]|nr:MAG: hypothetical protein A2283_19910 [Lentisphaerae bacterium RIFOXYA12_FULL_48_11]